MTPLAKYGLWISLALWTRRASPRDGVGTREHAWSRDLSGDCLPNGTRDPLGVRESRDLPTVTCSLGLGAEPWVRNNLPLQEASQTTYKEGSSLWLGKKSKAMLGNHQSQSDTISQSKVIQ